MPPKPCASASCRPSQRQPRSLAEAQSSLAMIEANAPLSIAAAKGMVNALSGVLHAADPDQLQALADACFESDDYKEGRRAFLEKRPPNFSGR